MTDTNRPLRVFLCHSSADKPTVRELYQKLRAEKWILPWLDEEELYPGQDWNLEIEKAIEETDVILVCLSKKSITKEGYVQKEIKIALDYSDYKPAGTVFIIPIRLEECKPPSRLSKWQYVDYFEEKQKQAFERILVSLKSRIKPPTEKIEKPVHEVLDLNNQEDNDQEIPDRFLDLSHPFMQQNAFVPQKLTLSNGMEFMRVAAGKFIMGSDDDKEDEKPQHIMDIPYDYWMARFPITNNQYNVYVEEKGIDHPVAIWKTIKNHPVICTSWFDAMEYCLWLNNIIKAELPPDLSLRLPTESEWEKAARSTDGRMFPWGDKFDTKKCNTREEGNGGTTPVGFYSPQSDSLYGCADMSGNVWEWTHSAWETYPYSINDGREDEYKTIGRVLRGGAFNHDKTFARCAHRDGYDPYSKGLNSIGFRISLAPPLRK